MPELPEVETICRGLARSLVGQVIEEVHLSRGDITHGLGVPLCAVLRGRRVRQIRRVAKHIRIDTDRSISLAVHLGMTGRLVVVDRDEPPGPHTHLRITFCRRRFELRFSDSRRFGALWLVDESSPGADGWLGRRLPAATADPLQLSLGAFRTLLDRRRQIKALLLDQKMIGGVGNIYCDESLHRAGIHPMTLANRLDEAAARRLHRALRQVLREAIRAGGSSIRDYRTAGNALGRFQIRHRVYGRDGQPCRGCRTLIERLVVAGRGTFICPRCQAKPQPTRRRTRRPDR